MFSCLDFFYDSLSPPGQTELLREQTTHPRLRSSRTPCNIEHRHPRDNTRSVPSSHSIGLIGSVHFFKSLKIKVCPDFTKCTNRYFYFAPFYKLCRLPVLLPIFFGLLTLNNKKKLCLGPLSRFRDL